MVKKQLRTIEIPVYLDDIIDALDADDMENIARLIGYVDGESLQDAAKHVIKMIRDKDYDGAILTLERTFFPKFVSKVAAMEKYHEAIGGKYTTISEMVSKKFPKIMEGLGTE